jgi:hypothetical protein
MDEDDISGAYRMHGCNEKVHAFVDRKYEGEISRPKQWRIWGDINKSDPEERVVGCALGSSGSDRANGG